MKRVIKSLLLSLAVLFLIAGCSAIPSNDTSNGEESNQEVELQEPEGTVDITVWYAVSGNSGDAFNALVQRFADENEKINVELTYSGSYADTAAKVSANLATNTAPDVALMAAGQLYTGGRGDYTMETLVEDEAFNKDDIYEGVWDYAKYEGRIAAVPYGISTPVLYYNKNITDAAGIDMSNPPQTWDELLEVAKVAQENGNVNNSSDFWGIEVSDVPWLFKSMLNQNGNAIVEQEGDTVTPVFNNESAIEVAEFWTKMIDEGVMPAGEHDNAENRFLSGNVAFMIASSNRVQRWVGETSVKLGAMEMPAFKEKSVALGGNVLVMFSEDAEKRWASWELIKYLTEHQNELALQTGYLPIRQSSLDSEETKAALEENPLLQVALDQLDYAWSYVSFDEMGTMDGFIYEAMEKIERKTATIEEALNEAVETLKSEME